MKRLKRLSVLLLTVIAVFSTAYSVSAASISKEEATLCAGQTVQLKINGINEKVNWFSSNKSVATVTQNGKVSAKKKGTTTVTARIEKKKYTCKITVETPKLSKTSITVKTGKTFQLKMQNTKQKYKWSSKSKIIATVTSSGKVTGKKAGTTYIYAKSASGKIFKCTVTVKSPSADKNALKMFLPNQAERGTANFYIESNSKRSTGGKIVEVKVFKAFPMAFINYYAENVNQDLTTFIYIDGELWNHNNGAMSIGGGGSLDGSYSKTGIHVIEMVQFENNNKSGTVVEYHRAMYKIFYQ